MKKIMLVSVVLMFVSICVAGTFSNLDLFVNSNQSQNAPHGGYQDNTQVAGGAFINTSIPLGSSPLQIVGNGVVSYSDMEQKFNHHGGQNDSTFSAGEMTFSSWGNFFEGQKFISQTNQLQNGVNGEQSSLSITAGLQGLIVYDNFELFGNGGINYTNMSQQIEHGYQSQSATYNFSAVTIVR